MTRKIKLSVEDMSLIIQLMKPHQQSFFMDMIQVLSIPINDTPINAPLNEGIQEYKPTPDIVDFKRSQPMNIMMFIELVALAKAEYYYLTRPDICLQPCPHCNADTVINMIYQKRNQRNDIVDFEVCLSCLKAHVLTPIYASAEGEVQS